MLHYHMPYHSRKPYDMAYHIVMHCHYGKPLYRIISHRITYHVSCIHAVRDVMFDACFRKAQSQMGALAPCAPPVCDYSNHVSVLSRTHLSCHYVCVFACVCLCAKGNFDAVLRPAYRRSTTTYMYLMHAHSCI